MLYLCVSGKSLYGELTKGSITYNFCASLFSYLIGTGYNNLLHSGMKGFERILKFRYHSSLNDAGMHILFEKSGG